MPLCRMAEQLLEVPKIIPQAESCKTVKQIIDRSEAKRADLAEAEKSAALMKSQAVQKQLHPSCFGKRMWRGK